MLYGFDFKETNTILYAAYRCKADPYEMANFATDYAAGNDGKLNGLITAYRNAHRRYH